jgi:5-methylcytosine-specific restriction protein A
MASRALQSCGHPGCGVTTRGSRCPKHAREKGRGTSRNRPGDPFYSSQAWRRLRRAVLAEGPLCVACLERDLTTAATEVDHVLDRVDRPDLQLARSNLQPLCKSCHSRKTRRTQNRKR